MSSLNGVREKISLFGGLTEREVSVVLPYLELTGFEKGECVFEQGALPTSVFIVLNGEVQLQTIKSNGGKAHVNFLPGDCFGESSVIGIQPQMGSAVAIKNTTVLELKSESLMVLAEADKEIFSVLMMNIAREVSRRLHSFFTCPDDCQELPVQRA
ncbi:MAG: cyclic nucleotide-binding domain-containing protein [Agarilytica sp.]